MGDGGCEAPLAVRGQDFPGGAVGKNPPAKAGSTGSVPDPGSPRMPQSNQARGPQPPSPLTHCRGPRALAPAFSDERRPHSEKPARHESGVALPHHSQRARALQQRPSTARETNLKISKRKALGEKKNDRSLSLQAGGYHSLRRTRMTGRKARVQ